LSKADYFPQFDSAKMRQNFDENQQARSYAALIIVNNCCRSWASVIQQYEGSESFAKNSRFNDFSENRQEEEGGVGLQITQWFAIIGH